MKTSDVYKFFGNKNRAAKALGISRQAVDQWGEYVPVSRQYHIQVVTRGKLKASK